MQAPKPLTGCKKPFSFQALWYRHGHSEARSKTNRIAISSLLPPLKAPIVNYFGSAWKPVIRNAVITCYR